MLKLVGKWPMADLFLALSMHRFNDNCLLLYVYMLAYLHIFTQADVKLLCQFSDNIKM